MTDLQHAIREGHYAKKQIHSRDWLIAWSHRRRFQTAVELGKAFAGKCVLDYGCGDGTFLGLLMAERSAPALAVGVETHASTVEDCRRRYRVEPRLEFVLTSDLDRPEHRGRYDAVFCMEVLEHVLDPEPLLAQFTELLAPDGKLIVSVPVETGLPLIAKQAIRRLAGWRRLGDYPGTSSYGVRELVASLLAGRRQHIVRPVFRVGSGAAFYDHKGFNWMVLRETVAGRFEIERCVGSPVQWLGPYLASQVCFVARPKAPGPRRAVR